MSTGIFSIGVSGLGAAQAALLATEHNVVNANTPGYSRQTTVQATNIAVNTGSGALGQGVHVQTIKRVYDGFLNGQVNTAQAEVNRLDAFYRQISQIDGLLADPNAGFSPALQGFFAGVQQVAANPSLLPARQSLISSAQTLTARIQSLDSSVSELANQVNERIVESVSSINAYASQIADLNNRIVVAEAAYNQPANDLLDQRDQLISELNKLIKVQTNIDSSGNYNVFIGSGQQLVVGAQVVQLGAVKSHADPSRLAIGTQTFSGPVELPDSLITGGQLGGLVEFRNQALTPVGNAIGRVAASLALTFNAQHQLGQDLLGNIRGDVGFVGDFFTFGVPKVIANETNIGAGAVAAAFAPPNEGGNFSTDLTSSDYRLTFGDNGDYFVTRLSDNRSVATGTGTGSLTVDGVKIDVSATGAKGDSFFIRPVVDVVKNLSVDTRIAADARLVAAGLPVRTTPAVNNTGSLKISQGAVDSSYSTANLPVTLTASTTALDGLPSGVWTAVYSDGSSDQVTNSVPLAKGTATLSKISFDGLSFTLTGRPDENDRFTFERNLNPVGVQDGRNAVLFAKLQTQNTTAGGTATFQAAYSQIVADTGIAARDAKIKLDAQKTVLTQAQSARDSVSGVNLDEEAANLIQFQRIYQASSKLLEVGSKLFDSILAIG